jgi:hypothetical protein
MLIRRLLCRGLFYIVVLAVVSFHLAYAQDRPDHTNALSQIKKLISNDDGSGSFTITKLVYVNGFQKDISNYIVLTTFTREFKVSSGTFQKSISSDNPVVSWAGGMAASVIWGHFEPGDSFDEECQFRFLRTENGWILQGYEGDTVVKNRHTGHADALDAQAKQLDAQEKQAQQVRQSNMAIQQQKETELHLTEVHNACASGQQVKVTSTGMVGLMGENNKALWYGPAPGQVVLCDAPTQILHFPGRAVEHNDYMCHIKFSSGKQVITGYTLCSALFVIKQ